MFELEELKKDMSLENLIKLTNDGVIDFISVFLKTNKNVIREQYERLNDYTKYQIIQRVLNASYLYANLSFAKHWDFEHRKELTEFFENIFEKPVVYISDFYKQLSEEFDGKYSPEELELICECEKNLAVKLLKTNDVVETKIAAFMVAYGNKGEPLGINPVIRSDFMENLKK